MKKLLLVLIFICLSSSVFAEQQFNPYSGKWITVPDNSNWENKFNPYKGDWSFQPPDSQLEFNPFEGKWDWSSGVGNEGN